MYNSTQNFFDDLILPEARDTDIVYNTCSSGGVIPSGHYAAIYSSAREKKLVKKSINIVRSPA